jgi:hypothetical protein
MPMLACSVTRQPAPVLALRGAWPGLDVRPNAFGNALGSSIAGASTSGGSSYDYSTAPNESDAETARLNRYEAAATDSTGDGNGLSFNRGAVAGWSRQVNTGIAAAASTEGSSSWASMPSGPSSSSSETFYPSAQVVASGVDAKGLAWYQYDDGAETHAVANPTIEMHDLDPAPAGSGLLASGRASMNSYWSDMQDAADASGSPLSYLAARGMQTLGNVGYSLADMADAVYNNPEQSVAGGLKSIANFGPDAFNSATNLVKTSLNGYSMLAEKLGAGDGTFAGFRGSDAYNITPLFSYDNQAQAGGALLTQVALGAGLAKYGDYGIELNTGSAGTLSANPLPFRLSPRATPGVVTFGDDLVAASGRWLDAGVPTPIPLQVARQLEGQTFNRFGDLRAAIWRSVANDADLSTGFGKASLGQMAEGNAPFAPRVYQTNPSDAGMRFNLHHIETVASGGPVYDLSNLRIVSPKVHFGLHN